MDVFWSLPPVTRTLVAGAVGVSALGYAGLLDLGHFVWWPERVFTLKSFPQLWRFGSAFLITKPNLGIIFDSYFLYQYGSQLERESSRFSNPGDFFTYVVFVGMVMLAVGSYFLNAMLFLQPLILAFAYTYAQDNPNRQVSMFILTFDAKFLPLAMLFLTMVMEGPPAALQQGTGLLAAHFYDFLTRIWPAFGGGRNYIVTPEFVKKWFGGGAGVPQARPYGFAMPGGGRRTEPSSAASATSSAWNSRGPGHRLGD